MILRLRSALNIFGWLIALIFFVAYSIQLGGLDGLNRAYQQLDGRIFAAALLVLVIGHAARSQLGYVSARTLGYPISRVESHRYWVMGQIAKYIPGGVWMFAAKAAQYLRHGMPVLIASAAVTWELWAVVFVGLILGIGSISAIDDAGWRLVITGGSLALGAGMALSLLPAFWSVFVRFKLPGTAKLHAAVIALESRRWILVTRLLIYSFIMWIITGIGFYLLLVSMDAGDIGILPAVYGYAAAWTIGFLTFFAPAGLGAREAVLTLVLTPMLGAEFALSLAVLARVWWSLAEVVHVIGTGILTWINNRNDRSVLADSDATLTNRGK